MRGQEDGADDGAEQLDLGGDGEVEEVETEVDGEADDGAGQDGADGEADDDAAEDEQEPPQRQVARESRYQRAIREAREAREEARSLRAEFERSRSQPQQPQPDPQAQARAEQEFNERLRLMDPADAIVAVRDRERQTMVQALMQIEGRNIERADKSEWKASVGTSKARARLADEVEAVIAAARARNDYQTTRETVFWTLYGREMESRSRAAAPGQQRAAQRRVASQTTRPASGRGEAGRPARRPAEDADEALLRSVTVGDL